jgi:hypothetical protein
VASIAMAFALSGCGKYDDGPTISLRSRNARIVNTWKIDKVMLDGMPMTTAEIAMDEGGADITNTFTKNGDYSYSFTNDMGVVQSGNGKWEFVNSDNDIKIFGVDGIESETSTILRLTNDELWYWHMDGSMKMEMHWKTK